MNGKSKASIQSTKVICKQRGRYIGWPSVVEAPNGDLLVVFSGDRDSHVSNDGKLQMVRSKDCGQTWETAGTIFDTPIDDRDAGINLTRNGTILVDWFTGPYGGEWQGNWVVRSADQGVTWEHPVRTNVTSPHGPIQLKNGPLLFIGQRPHCSHGNPQNWNGQPALSPYTVAVEESCDDGRSWEVVAAFPIPKDARMLSYDEPHLVELDDGNLLVLFRDCNGRRMRQSESADQGRTWSTPHITPVEGLPPHIIRLRNNWLLLSYAKRWEPYGNYACISRDGGVNWDVENEIRLSSAANGDLGYPASVQIKDGSIWTVYYQVDKPGEKPCLMGTYWRIL